MAQDRNTTRPERAAVPTGFKRLPAEASTDQIIHAFHEMAIAYATIAAEYTTTIPELQKDNEEMRVIQEAHGVRLGRLEVWRAEMEASVLPPMREKFASSNDIAAHIGEVAAKHIEAEQRNVSTPPPDAAKIAQIIADPVKIAVDEIKAGWWDRLEKERKDAESERVRVELKAKEQRDALALDNERSRNKTKWAIALAAALALGTLIRELAEHYLVR